jgi:hypothetical protein
VAEPHISIPATAGHGIALAHVSAPGVNRAERLFEPAYRPIQVGSVVSDVLNPLKHNLSDAGLILTLSYRQGSALSMRIAIECGASDLRRNGIIRDAPNG